MLECTIFTTEKELQKLTELSHEELWEKGFNLDDWDIGFMCEIPLSKSQQWLINRMNDYCCGYEHIEYDGMHYYMVYHS